MLNPVFSTGHLRNLTPLFYDVAFEVSHLLGSTARVVATKSLICYIAASDSYRVMCEGWPARSRHPRMDEPHCYRAGRTGRAGLFFRSTRTRHSGAKTERSRSRNAGSNHYLVLSRATRIPGVYANL
ncbi:hypothetical protein C8Q74DRAFT_708863 [Fomes fomentarius]|nr:hypothetical protein C8Q74DRAFT_708863 [Fomes fomentarius]